MKKLLQNLNLFIKWIICFDRAKLYGFMEFGAKCHQSKISHLQASFLVSACHKLLSAVLFLFLDSKLFKTGITYQWNVPCCRYRFFCSIEKILFHFKALFDIKNQMLCCRYHFLSILYSTFPSFSCFQFSKTGITYHVADPVFFFHSTFLSLSIQSYLWYQKPDVMLGISFL